MSENREALVEMADGLFADLRGKSASECEAPLAEAGFVTLLVPEENGGFGGDWGDLAAVLRLAGFHALAAPLGEQIVEAAREHRNDIPGDSITLAAFLRVCQAAGALDGSLKLAIDHCSERQQFGRPLSKFQAVQQSIALLAMEAAAANCAAQGAAAALDRGDGAFEIACAKLRANEAMKHGSALAHQVHGAIGFTRDYPLQQLTRRMMAWRSEGGNDAYWSTRIGKQALEWGGTGLWDNLTTRTD